MSVILLPDKWQWQRKKHTSGSKQAYTRALKDSRDACLNHPTYYWTGEWQDLSAVLVQKWFQARYVHVGVVTASPTASSSTVTSDDEEDCRDVSAESRAATPAVPWCVLNQFLFRRVLSTLHYITYPNTASWSEWEGVLQSLFGRQLHVGEVWCWLGQEEAKALDVKRLGGDLLHPPSSAAAASLWSVEVETYRNIFHYAVLGDHLALLRLLCAAHLPWTSAGKGVMAGAGGEAGTGTGTRTAPVNQTDWEERSALHLAAEESEAGTQTQIETQIETQNQTQTGGCRLPHLLLLVQHPHVILDLTDRNDRTFLHSLLLAIRRRSTRRQRVDVHLVHQILAICLGTQNDLGREDEEGDEEEGGVGTNARGGRRPRGADLVLMQDNCGFDLLDYAIMSNVASVLAQVVEVLDAATEAPTSRSSGSCSGSGSSRLQLSEDIDWSRYLHRAILCNKASSVMAIASRLLRSQSVLVVDHDQYTVMLGGFLSFAVESHCSTALMALLTFKEFVRAVNTAESMGRGEGGGAAGVLPLPPLLAAVAQCQLHDGGRGMDMLRVLLKFGANPLIKPPHSFFSFAPPPTPTSDSDLGSSDWCSARLCALVVHDFVSAGSHPHSHPHRTCSHDNVFSFLASQCLARTPLPGGSIGRAGNVLDSSSGPDVLRTLLLTTRHACCFVPAFTRRAQADEVFISTPSSSSGHADNDVRTDGDTPTTLHYFFDYACFFRNPLISLLLTLGLKAQRLNQLHNPEYLRFHPFRLPQAATSNNKSIQLLEYLLQHTPFANLIDIQEGYSGLTPLAAACWAGNTPAVELLLRRGANPWTPMNAFLAHPSDRAQTALSRALTAWNEAVHAARRHISTPVRVAKAIQRVLLEQNGRVRSIRDRTCAALDSLRTEGLNVLAAAQWGGGQSSAPSSRARGYIGGGGGGQTQPYTLPANSIDFFNHFIWLLDVLAPHAAEALRESNGGGGSRGGSGGDLPSHHFASSRAADLSVLGAPASLIHRARRLLKQYSRQVTTATGLPPTLTSTASPSEPHSLVSLDRSVVERLRSMDKHYSALNPDTHSSSTAAAPQQPMNGIHLRMQQAGAVKYIQSVLSQWSRSLLELYSLDKELQQLPRTEAEAGLALHNLRLARHEVLCALNGYMSHQRIHTAHNYLTQPAESYSSSPLVPDSSETLYAMLFCSEPAVPLPGGEAVESLAKEGEQQRQQQLRWDNLLYTSALVGRALLPSLQLQQHQQQPRRRVEARTRSDRLWWWDAVQDRAWPLLRRLIPDMCLEESCLGMEQLVVQLVLQRAPLSLIRQLLRNGVRLGKTCAHLELAVRQGNPLLLLTLLVCGSFPTDSREFWVLLLDVFHAQPAPAFTQYIPEDKVCWADADTAVDCDGTAADNDSYAEKEAAGGVGGSGGGGICGRVNNETETGTLDQRRRSLREILKTGLESAGPEPRPRHDLPSVSAAAASAGRVTLPQSSGPYAGVFSAVPGPVCHQSTGHPSSDSDSSDSDSDSGSDARQDTCMGVQKQHIYTNKESVVRSPLGQLTLLTASCSSSHHHHEEEEGEGGYALMGVLGVHGKPVSLPVIPSIETMARERHQSLRLTEFWQNHRQLLQPADRFLLAPSHAILCTGRENDSVDGDHHGGGGGGGGNDSDANGDNESHAHDNWRGDSLSLTGVPVDSHLMTGLVRGLFQACSAFTTTLLLSALHTGGIATPSMLSLPPVECTHGLSHSSEARKSGGGGGGEAIPAIMLAARSGHVGMVHSLLEEYLFSGECASVTAPAGQDPDATQKKEATPRTRLGFEEFYR
jgi:hypothetical protein